MRFAIITPALDRRRICRAHEDSGSMALFLSLRGRCSSIAPMAHMVWGVGGLLNATAGHIPSLDFAGGTVVHITSGVCGAG